MMNIEQRDGTWSILNSEATQSALALDMAQQAAAAASPEEVATYVAGRRRLGQRALDAVNDPWLSGRGQGLELSPGIGLSPAPRRLKNGDGLKDYTMLIIYKSDKAGTENVFTGPRLREACELERDFLQQAAFSKLQLLDSVAALFYGSEPELFRRSLPQDGNWSCHELDQESISATLAAMKASMDTLGSRSPLARFVHPIFRSTGESPNTRTAVAFSVTEDDAPKVPFSVMKYLGRDYGFFQDGFFSSSAYMGEEDVFTPKGAVRVRLVSSAMNEFQVMVGPDFILAIGSVVLVWVMCAVYLKSAFMASCGMAQILMSLPIAAIIYKGLGIAYFDFLHVLVVYLVLGIGADDIFVLLDSIRHSGDQEYPVATEGRYEDDVLKEVLKLGWVRSAGAMFNTSFTTAMSFMSCSGSSAMPLRTCGWYAALSILTNYVLVITFSPAWFVIWHQRLQGKRCGCCSRYRLRPVAVLAPPGTQHEPPKPNCLERFINKVYIRAMNYQLGSFRPVPWALLLVMLGVAAQGTYFTSQLTPPRQAEVWFPERHMLSRIADYLGEHFYQPDYERYSVVELVFGVQGYDTSKIDIYNPGGPGGKVIFDRSFDLSSPLTQDAVLRTCEWLKQVTCDLPACKNIGYSTFRMQTDKKTHSCFLEDFRDWNGGVLPTGADFLPRLIEFRDTANPRAYTSEVLSEEVDYKKDIGIVGGELRFAVIKIRSTMASDTPYSRGVEVSDMFRGALSRHLGDIAPELSTTRVVCNVFYSLDLSHELLSQLFSGCAIALPISFLVVLASTRNVVVSLYAVICVAFIVLSVLGFCRSAMNWDLGVGEAIAGVIVIGYSVDYVVHLAHIYCEASHHGISRRHERAEFAVKNMGSTVFAGALTTVGSGIVMFFCFFYFFVKMAILICVTIMYSLLFALCLFMAMMWVAGPQGNFGDLPDFSAMFTRRCSTECARGQVHPMSKIEDAEERTVTPPLGTEENTPPPLGPRSDELVFEETEV